MGRDVMEAIDAGFRDGGALAGMLDGSSAFRPADAGATVRGRSWALHDGVGNDLWGGASVGGVKMYRAAGRHAGINTFPGAPY
jgi:acetoin utilization protein AcuC